MAREQKRKEIDGYTFLVTQMDGFRALKVQAKLIKILSPGVSSMSASSFNGLFDDKGQPDINKIIGILQPVISEFNDKEVVGLVNSLFEKEVFIEAEGKTNDGEVKKYSKPIDFSEFFAGKPLLLWKVVGFIIEANFATGK